MIFLKEITYSVLYYQRIFLRHFCVAIHDKNFEYFRLKPEYKNSVVQLTNDQNTTTGPDFSFVLQEYKIQTDGFFSHLQHRENVMKLSSIQVKDILCLMANSKLDTSKYALALKYLDEKCALSVERWPLDLSFYILDAWFIILGPKIFKKYYYSAIASQWGRRMKKCSKFNLILMLYFIGMSKLPPPFLMEMIEDKMESYIADFSDEEYAVACLSFFKTSKKLKSKPILQQSCVAAANLLSKNDRFNGISILKCLRLSKYYDEQLWNTLRDYTLQELRNFNFVECTNFLAIFSAQNYYDAEVFNVLEDQGILALDAEEKKLKEEGIKINLKLHPSVRSRVKDFARYLWACSSIGHVPKKSSLHIMSKILTSKLEMGEFEHQTNALIDILQSLALLGYYPYSILKQTLVRSTLNHVLNQEKSKPKYQLYFVQKSVQIENPEIEIEHSASIFDNPIPKNLEKDIKDRKGFRDLIEYLKKYSTVEFWPCYLMPHIMIAGIIFSIGSSSSVKSNSHLYQKYLQKGIISKKLKGIFQNEKRYICIEIFDNMVCVKDKSLPLGLMKTKIRQLKYLNLDVIELSTEDILSLINASESDNREGIKKLLKLIDFVQ